MNVKIKKIIFEKKVVNGKYEVVKDEDKNFKEITMYFSKKNKSKIIWQIEFSNNNIKIVAPFLGIKWLSYSADKKDTFIEIPKQLNESERLSYPFYMQKFLTDSKSSTTSAWLNLNGKRKNLGYFGQIHPIAGGGRVVHKEFLEILSKELGIKIKQF